jgi:dTDP-4-dehydrorhamnose reductase
MTVLMFGQTGQMAQAVQALAHEVVALGRGTPDLAAFAAAIAAHRPAAVLNAAASTALDRAETE